MSQTLYAAAMTTTAARAGENRIPNPLVRGQQVTFPAGTVATSMNPRRRHPFAFKRAVTIRLHMVSDGWIDLWNDARCGVGYIHLPEACFAGSGGYWTDVRLTPELCERLGAPTLTLPRLNEWDRSQLDIDPCFGPGYDNRLSAPRV